MPMTPEEVARKRADLGDPEVARLCEDIDDSMLRWEDSVPFWWRMPVYRDGGKIMNAIIDIYTKKGWRVRPIDKGYRTELEFTTATN